MVIKSDICFHSVARYLGCRHSPSPLNIVAVGWLNRKMFCNWFMARMGFMCMSSGLMRSWSRRMLDDKQSCIRNDAFEFLLVVFILQPAVACVCVCVCYAAPLPSRYSHINIVAFRSVLASLRPSLEFLYFMRFFFFLRSTPRLTGHTYYYYMLLLMHYEIFIRTKLIIIK